MKTFRIALWLALAALMISGQAMATPDLNVTFQGLPTGSYVQQDKSYSGFTDVNNNFLSIENSATSIKTVTFTNWDLHTVSFTGSFLGNQVYDIKYKVEITDPISPYLITRVGIGIDQSFGGIGSLTKIVRDSANNILGSFTITGNTADYSITPQKFIYIEDILTTNSAGVNSISNSFTQSAATTVPEPGTLGLMGFSLVGLGFFSQSAKRGVSALFEKCSLVKKRLRA